MRAVTVRVPLVAIVLGSGPVSCVVRLVVKMVASVHAVPAAVAVVGSIVVREPMDGRARQHSILKFLPRILRPSHACLGHVWSAESGVSVAVICMI